MANFRNGSTASLTLAVALICCAPRVKAQEEPTIAADYSRAEALVKDRQWSDGLQVLSRVLAAEPSNLKALNLAGIACAATGDSREADRYFERAVAVDPLFLPALKNLSISEFNEEEYAAAKKHLMAAQEQQPNDPIINLYLGQISYREHDYTVAADYLGRARSLITRSPEAEAAFAISLLRSDRKAEALELLDKMTPSAIDTRSQVELGVALAQAGSNAQATSYLQAAFDHDPKEYNIGFDLTLAYVHDGNYAAAVKTIQVIIQSNHDTSELEDLLAEALAGQGNPREAADAYRRAITLDPSDENNYLDFASLCVDHRQFEDGMKVIALGLQLQPDSERLVFMRGILNALEDKNDLAEKDFQRAAQLAPKHDFGAVGLGAVYLQQGKSGEAIEVTRRQLKQKPDDPSLLYLLGEALIASGIQPGQASWEEAQRSIEESVKLNPGLCLPHISLGSIYLREDRFADAAAQFELARSIDPNENSAYSHLAMAYRRLGQPEKSKEALMALQKMLEEQRSGTRTTAKTSSTPKPKNEQ